MRTAMIKQALALLGAAVLLIGGAVYLWRQGQTYEDPSLYWCKVLTDSKTHLSCDWPNECIPKQALTYWHTGKTPKDATIQAVNNCKKQTN